MAGLSDGAIVRKCRCKADPKIWKDSVPYVVEYVKEMKLGCKGSVILLFNSEGSKSPAMYVNAFTAIFWTFVPPPIRQGSANSHASRVQVTPPPCPLCSQRSKLPTECLLYMAGLFYCIGISQKIQYLSVMSPATYCFMR